MASVGDDPYYNSSESVSRSCRYFGAAPLTASKGEPFFFGEPTPFYGQLVSHSLANAVKAFMESYLDYGPDPPTLTFRKKICNLDEWGIFERLVKGKMLFEDIEPLFVSKVFIHFVRVCSGDCGENDTGCYTLGPHTLNNAPPEPIDIGDGRSLEISYGSDGKPTGAQVTSPDGGQTLTGGSVGFCSLNGEFYLFNGPLFSTEEIGCGVCTQQIAMSLCINNLTNCGGQVLNQYTGLFE